MARVRPTVKCNTSDHPKWGQVPTPLNEFCLKRQHLFATSCHQNDTGIFFHASRHRCSLCRLFHLSTFTFILFHLPTLIFFTSSLNLHLETTMTQISHGLANSRGCIVSSFAMLEGVCWNISCTCEARMD